MERYPEVHLVVKNLETPEHEEFKVKFKDVEKVLKTYHVYDLIEATLAVTPLLSIAFLASRISEALSGLSKEKKCVFCGKQVIGKIHPACDECAKEHTVQDLEEMMRKISEEKKEEEVQT